MKVYLGIDVSSVATKLAVLDEQSELITHSYQPTQGDPIGAVQQGLRQVRERLPRDAKSRVWLLPAVLAIWPGSL